MELQQPNTEIPLSPNDDTEMQVDPADEGSHPESFAEEKTAENEPFEEKKDDPISTEEFPYFVGQHLDVLDSVNRWSEAEVRAIDKCKRSIRITYLFWSETFDEWVEISSERVAPLHTHTYFPGGVLKLGQRLDVQDEVQAWREAFVIGEEETRVQVHYRGFTAKFDDWIPRDSPRIRPYGRLKEVAQRKKLRCYEASTSARPAQIVVSTDRFSHYQRALQTSKLRLVSVAGDGNCLFRSVSHQIYGDDSHHMLVRARCMDYIESEREFFQQFIVGSAEEFARYVHIKRQNAVWGDDPEVQAMCEIYDRPAEIWVYDQHNGARKLRTFHEAAGERRGHFPMRLSYYGGGHYDSLCGEDFETHVTRFSPGTLENAALERSRQRQAAGVISDERRRGDAEHGLEERALELALTSSRRDFDMYNDDLDQAFLESINDIASEGKGEDAVDFVQRLQPAMTDAEFAEESKRRELIESQGAIMQSVTQQSEMEFIEKALVESLQTSSQVTEDDLLQQALNASLTTDDDITQAIEASLVAGQPPSEEEQMRMALELSQLSEDELLQRVLEESSRHMTSDEFGELDDPDPELLAAIAQSMSGV